MCLTDATAGINNGLRWRPLIINVLAKKVLGEVIKKSNSSHDITKPANYALVLRSIMSSVQDGILIVLNRSPFFPVVRKSRQII